MIEIDTTNQLSLISDRQRQSKFKTGVLLKRFKYKIHYTTKSSKQPLTAEQTQNEGVVGDFYIRELPHNHALSAIANG